MDFADIVSPRRPVCARHGAMDVAASHGRRLARATRIGTIGDEWNMVSRRGCVSVGIVDNDCLALSALGRYVNTVIPGCSVVWMYETGRDALARCTEQGFPQVVLVDMSMTDMAGRSRSGEMYHYYRCSSKNNSKEKALRKKIVCSSRSVNRDKLESLVLDTTVHSIRYHSPEYPPVRR